jgi:hypothetical protein
MFFPTEWIDGRLCVWLPGDHPVYFAMAVGYYGA